MKAWICRGIAALLAVLAALVLPECVRDARRLFRLSRGDGLRLAAEITRIEEESVSTNEDSADRAQYGPTKIEEVATLRYIVAGTEYQARHRLPEPIHRHHPGDRIEILALPDEPGHSYATYQLTGSWIMTFMLPGILLFGAVTLGYVGYLFASTSAPDRRVARRR